MFINELSAGTEVALEATDGTKQLSFPTKVSNITTQVDKDRLEILNKKRKEGNIIYCICDPIREQECLVRFEGENVAMRLFLIQNENPYAWENVRIMNLRLPDYGSVHIVVSSKRAIACNRRGNFRVWLGADGTLREPKSKDKIDVIVKDISESGVGLIIKEENDVERGKIYQLRFAEEEREYEVSVIVARVQQLEDGRYNVGCRIRGNSDVIAKLVHIKQRERIRLGAEKRERENHAS